VPVQKQPLAQEILSGRFGPGDEVRVDVVDGQLSFDVASGKTASAA